MTLLRNHSHETNATKYIINFRLQRIDKRITIIFSQYFGSQQSNDINFVLIDLNETRVRVEAFTSMKIMAPNVTVYSNVTRTFCDRPICRINSLSWPNHRKERDGQCIGLGNSAVVGIFIHFDICPLQSLRPDQTRK